MYFLLFFFKQKTAYEISLGLVGSEMCIRDSVLLVGTVATFFANYIKNHKWVGVLGLVVILFVAVQLILGGVNEFYPGTLPNFILKVI